MHTSEAPLCMQVDPIESLPPLPQSFQRFMQIAQEENATVSDLENLIRWDEALCAKIMRIANSAYYGLRGKVHTLSRAIMNMGFHEVKSICLFNLLMESFPAAGSLGRMERERLWKHALATATHSSEIARVRPWINKDEAYDLGLLHDVGWVVMLVHFREEYELVNQLAEDENVPPWEVESQFDLKHTQLGKWLAIKWGLPESHQRAMAFHHQPERSPSFQPFVKIVSLGSVLAHLEEFPHIAVSTAVVDSCRDLRIADSEWQEHIRRVETVRKEVDELWQLLR